MALTNAERQAKYRGERTKARAALHEIIVLVEPKTGPVAVEVKRIAEEGLS